MVPGVFNHFDVLAAIIEPDAVVVMYHAVRYRVEPVFRDREKSVSKHKSRVWPPVFVSIPTGHKRNGYTFPLRAALSLVDSVVLHGTKDDRMMIVETGCDLRTDNSSS